MNARLLLASALVLASALLLAAAPASRIEQVRTARGLECAIESRPGLDGPRLCARLALGLIGPGAVARSSAPDGPAAFARAAAADVAVLSDQAIHDNGLDAVFEAGPVVFIDPITLIAPTHSAIRVPSDLPGHSVCLVIGSPAHAALEARFGQATPPIQRLAFSEDVEMLDAYNVGRCDAAVGEGSGLGAMLRRRGINQMQSRVLEPPFDETVLRLRTPAGDGTFAALVKKAFETP